MNQALIDAFWQTFQAGLPAGSPYHDQPFTAEPFGDSPALADELAALIVQGVKTATCSCLWEWEVENEDLPAPGMLSIVLDGQDRPLCIIETTTVSIRPYNEVEASFAAAEGEGDRSLTYWCEAHWRYFSRVLPKIGRQPTETMPLVCEYFRVIHL